MSKPTRQVRRFVRRKGKGKGKGKSKGKGKGASRFQFLAEMDDIDYDRTFYGGKGKSNGKNRSSGKGKGRRQNPTGADGQIMTCGICGSETHFRAQCPRNTNRGASSGSRPDQEFASYAGAGPLGNLLYMQAQDQDQDHRTRPMAQHLTTRSIWTPRRNQNQSAQQGAGLSGTPSTQTAPAAEPGGTWPMQWQHGGYSPMPQFSGDGWTRCRCCRVFWIHPGLRQKALKFSTYHCRPARASRKQARHRGQIGSPCRRTPGSCQGR